jgi:hypothetical protein
MALTPKEWAREIEGAIKRTPRQAVGVVRKGANRVKIESRRNVRRTAPIHNAGAHAAINYDVEARGVEVVGEIGYDKSIKAGRLGNLLEFGGGGDHSPPHHDLARALDGEAGPMADALADLGRDLLLSKGKAKARPKPADGGGGG